MTDEYLIRLDREATRAKHEQMMCRRAGKKCAEMEWTQYITGLLMAAEIYKDIKKGEACISRA